MTARNTIGRNVRPSASKKAPLVTIIAQSYNHQKYIAQALEGFLMQQTNFTFEIIMHDDASTDGTADIIREYARKYPQLFKLILQKENQYSQHGVAFLGNLYRQATGKYVCICECDDYWTDPQKLQLQVDFLESHPDYATCFHPVKVVFENGEEEDTIYPSKTSGFTLQELLKQNYIQTNSVMYRRQTYEHIPTDIMPIDWYMHLYHAQFGKIGFINRVMAVYRRHSGGLWWSQRTKPEQIWKTYGYNFLRLLHEIMVLYGGSPEYRRIINSHIAGSYEAISAIKPERTSDDVATQSISEMPAEAWDYMKQLMQQVSHQADQAAHLERLVEGEKATNEVLSNELQNIQSSKAWKAMLAVRFGSYSAKHPISSVKRVVHRKHGKRSGSEK